MPTFAVKAAKSVTESSSVEKGEELKVDFPYQRVSLKSPQAEPAGKTPNFGIAVTQRHPGSPPKNGSLGGSEVISKTTETVKQLTINGSGSNDTAQNTRTMVRLGGAWGLIKPDISSSNGKVPIVMQKSKKPEENGKEIFKPPFPFTEQLQKKMKLSTVPKVVPLINTVGNQSKLIPLTFPPANQTSTTTPTTGVNSSVSQSQSKLVKKDTSKSMSILEATLTSAPKDQSNGTNIPKSRTVTSSSSNLPLTSDDQSLNHENSLDKGTNPSAAISKLIKKPKCVISYEKGVTRLVAVERRTVTMVDVSVQVSIPQFDAENQGQLLTVPTNAVSSETGSIQPQTTSTLPLPQKPFVVVDANGKKVFAISKQILSTYGGAKKIVIEGKGIKRKADTSIESLVNDDVNRAALPISVNISQSGQPSLSSSDSSQSNLLSGKTLSDNPPDASLSFETLTTSSCQTLPSISSSHQNLCNSSNSIGAQYCDTAPNQSGLTARIGTSSRPTVLLSQTPSRSHVITSDSLVLPLDAPFQFEGSSSQETICVPSSKIQTFSKNSDSIVLPLHSPIGTQSLHSDDASMGVFPNYFIVMPSSNNSNIDPGKALKDALNEPPTYSPLMDLIDEVKAGHQRKTVSSSSQPKSNNGGQVNSTVVPMITKNPVTSSSNNLNGKDHSNLGKAGGNFSKGKVISASSPSNGVLEMSAKGDIENLVRSALSDFKQCLSMNKDGQYPIHAAVESDDVAALKRQCIVLKARRASVDIKNQQDETPLQLALYFGHTPCIKVLLEHGASGNFFDQDGNSSLHLAILYAGDALRFLLMSGRFSQSFLNCLNDEGFSALHLAAQSDKVEAIKLLIKFGADVDLPLFAFMGFLAVVSLLVEFMQKSTNDDFIEALRWEEWANSSFSCC
ncbi:uncharacterized protein LOC113208529 isoform X2 [Frankliniella occidentalis]|uniref:Uncharacterized protein LOC113208529 isoform X2 n=1 Tax=Frankliniella occidentalis TaxID=133901 RepID=A0A6J1SK90_FRAOC|nr:uncharacterized protein LOC113208529 isoform X2 [Frankliniella occidentalis]